MLLSPVPSLLPISARWERSHDGSPAAVPRRHEIKALTYAYTVQDLLGRLGLGSGTLKDVAAALNIDPSKLNSPQVTAHPACQRSAWACRQFLRVCFVRTSPYLIVGYVPTTGGCVVPCACLRRT